MFQIIGAKQTGTKGKGLKKNRMVQSGSKVETYLKASPLVVGGTPDQGEKFQGPKWMTPPESGEKKIHKKKTDSDEDDLVKRFGMFRSTDCGTYWFDKIKGLSC